MFRKKHILSETICLTGLAEIAHLVAIQEDNFHRANYGCDANDVKPFNPVREMEQCTQYITALLDRLISQLPVGVYLKIQSFDPAGGRPTIYRSSVQGAIAKSQFKNRIISFSFKNEVYQSNNPDNFVLNCAGTEIEDVRLLNNRRFVDTSLYGYANPKEREAILENLHLIPNEQTGRLEAPWLVYGGYPVDRRLCHILSRTSYEMYYTYQKQYESAHKALQHQETKEAKEARVYLRGLNFRMKGGPAIRLGRSDAEKLMSLDLHADEINYRPKF